MFREGTTKKSKDACWHIEIESNTAVGKCHPTAVLEAEAAGVALPTPEAGGYKATNISSSWTRSLCCSHQQLMGISEKRRGQ